MQGNGFKIGLIFAFLALTLWYLFPTIQWNLEQKQISDLSPSDSAQYVDGSIDTAHIADDQVTLAKMAGITRGSIIIGNSSGNPAALALGTNDYVLTSDGTDLAWEEAGGGITIAEAIIMAG